MNPKHIIVIGGGISGLAAAHRFQELAHQKGLAVRITLIEARSRFGGVIQTERRNGFLVESGAESFITDKPWALDLCRQLRLKGELLETNPQHRRSFVYRRGKLIEVPEGFYLLAPARIRAFLASPLLSWRGKFRTLLEWWVKAETGAEDESLACFVRRRFGREVLERIAEPMIGGIYTADPEELSLEASLPRFRRMEAEFGSVIRALRARKSRREAVQAERASGPRYSLFVTLRSGMDTLVRALIERLKDAELRRSTAVVQLDYDGGWQVELSNGERLEAEQVCLALPAHAASSLLARAAPELSRALSAIPYESAATVNLGFNAADIRRPLCGFGFVVPAAERLSIVGCTFSSVKFEGRAPHGKVLLRAFLGGRRYRALDQMTDPELIAKVQTDLQQALGIRAEPVFTAIRRHGKSMPQYHVGHLARVRAIESLCAQHQGLFLTGNVYGGIGVPDCIHHAERVAEQMMESARAVPVTADKNNAILDLQQSRPSPFDHVLLIGFGAPEKSEDIKPFLQEFARGKPIPEHRLQEAERRYRWIGGSSPYNAHCRQLSRALQEALAARGAPIPVYLGMKNWHPFLSEALKEINAAGLKRGVGVVLAPHRSEASYGRYVRGIKAAKQAAEAKDLTYEYLDSWHAHPLFLEAQARQVAQAVAGLNFHEQTRTHVIFTAHSIPLDMAQESGYAEAVKTSARGVANLAGVHSWRVAYQSRSGRAGEPWLEPDVETCLTQARSAGYSCVALAPIGFLCENAEVLFDLDVAARAVAESLGLKYLRAGLVMGENDFPALLSNLILECQARLAGKK